MPLEFVREGDTLVVTKPDRLARSTADLLAIVGKLEAKGVGLMVLSMGGQPLDTHTAIGKMMLTVLAAIAEFERNLMLDGSARASPGQRRTGNIADGRRPLVALQIGFASCGRTECQPR